MTSPTNYSFLTDLLSPFLIKMAFYKLWLLLPFAVMNSSL